MKNKKWYWKSCVAFILLLVLTTQTYAGSLDDAQKDKEDAEANKNEAQRILSELEKDKSDLASYIQELDAQMDAIQVQITDLNQQKSELEAKITETEAALEDAKIREEQQYQEMCVRIQFMYENSTTDYLTAILSSESMSDILNRPEYAAAMSQYDYQMLENMVAIREEIAATEQELQNALADVEVVTAQEQEKEATVNTLLEAKAVEMQKCEENIEDQKELVEQYDAEIQAAADRIAEIEAEAARAIAAAAENNESVDTGSGETYVPYGGGSLTWPCPSSTKINSGFGTREASGVVTANHYGIDIGCPDGTPIVAAASGVVVLARTSATAGNWIIISHGDGLYTIYMHASVMYVTEGQYVNAGDTIMLSGATGATQGRHLHFEVRVGGYTSSQYSVDPMGYF